MKRTFDITTAGGLVLGVIAIFGSFMLEGGSIGALILLPAMTIVFLGTFSAAMIGTSLKNFMQIGTMLKLALFPPSYEVKDTIESIGIAYETVRDRAGTLPLLTPMSEVAGRMSVQVGATYLEKERGGISNAFMKKILRFAIDGTEPEVLRALAETEVNYVGERHGRAAAIFQKMGGYSPTMGIIGTVMGLIATLASAGEDANILIRHIASAFIATLWGVFMANIVWLPIADTF